MSLLGGMKASREESDATSHHGDAILPWSAVPCPRPTLGCQAKSQARRVSAKIQSVDSPPASTVLGNGNSRRVVQPLSSRSTVSRNLAGLEVGASHIP